MALITAAAGGGNWTVGGTWVGGVAPTAADDALLTVASGNVTINSGAVCRSLDCNTYTGTLTHTAAVSLTIGDGTAGAGNIALRLVAGMTYTLGNNNTSILLFNSTSVTQQTLTFGGKTTSQLQFATAGNWIFSDAWTGAAANTVLTHTAGTVNTNGQTITCGVLSSSNSNVRTLTLGASSVTLSSTGTALSFITSTNLTFNADTSTITLNGAGATFNGGGMAFNNIVITGSGTPIITGGGTTAVNLTRTGTAVKTDGLQLNTNFTFSGTFTATGNSATNRLLVVSNPVGTARTITAAVVSLTNVDFMDIAGAGAATWTGTSVGDTGGNTGITFTTPVTRYGVGSGGQSWSSTSSWSATSGGASGESVPLPQDTVLINASSGATSYVADMPRLGMDITFTGYTGTFSFTTAGTIFGSLTLASGMTYSGASTLTLGGRGTHTITTAGKPILGAILQNGPGGTYTLQDALTISAQNLSLSAGTFTTNNFTLTMSHFISNNALVTANLGTSTINLTGASAISIWNHTAGTLNASTSTIVITAASTNTRTFAGNAKVYGTLTYTVDNSPGSLTITGANTFATLNVDSGKILTMPSSTTNTVTNFNVNGAVNGYVYMPGIAANYASAPDSAAVSVSSDVTMDIKVAMDDWTPAASQTFIGKWDVTGNQRSYQLGINTVGQPFLLFSNDGTATASATSTDATGVADGATKWIRGTWRTSDDRAQFFTSDDGSSWTQLGTDRTLTLTTIFDSTAPVEVGSFVLGTLQLLAGKLYQARIYSDVTQTTKVFDADFATKTVGANSFTESSSNAATVTINGTLAQAGDGRVSLVSSSAGSAATLSKTSGVVSVNYLSIKDSTAAGSTWYAGANSTNVSGNTGWFFSSPPSPSGPATADGFMDRRTAFIYRSIPTIGSGTPQDLWLRYLATVTGASGTETDLTYIFLRQKGGTGEKLSGLWRSYLNFKGYSNGSVYDDMMNLFDSGSQV